MKTKQSNDIPGPVLRKFDEEDPLAILEVFDRIEVGPVKLEKNKLTAPYTLYWDDQQSTNDLVYSYEEDVFQPDDASQQNLANMIAAQVALNYGLVCRSILFHGDFDPVDQRFLAEMTENTAREIYVKKFLEPNPFLSKDVAGLPVIKQKSYSRAELIFSKAKNDVQSKWQMWSTDPRKHCILSSGGKDSLLSYSLIDDLGYQTYPVFINESGRHWFTALNAFRHFREAIPNTMRVWMNSDRIFNWVLRFMPFIRKDFQDIRSDEYPFRLWTVAVFLFGSLPLMRKHSIGRLLIGNEFDTTSKISFKGITHFDGLYDQSRYFDDALSRYYMQKGWAISQFSILRPLSEMLIEKILVERYPDLQRHQMSCHATHKESDRVMPCGKCEKCRRIVGMLTVLEADPRNCGYSEKQIKDCLNSIVQKGVHQEGPGKEHLNFMLSQKGYIQFPPEQKITVREHPVIMKLRFTQDRSPIGGIPEELRHALYSIYLKHSEGAVKKEGRKWIDFDPLADPGILAAFPFEMGSRKEKSKDEKSVSRKSNYLWSELTWPEAEQRLKEVDVAILPVGAIEQHGPHLTLDVDAYDAGYLARSVAQACSDPKPLVLPCLSYGVSYHHDDFPGTISINNNTLSTLVYEIGMSVASNGINKLIIINGHGGNTPALNFAAQMINRDAKIFVCVDSGETSDFDIYKMIETPNDVHAGEFETSTSLATRPQLVHLDRAEKSIPSFSSRYLNFTSKRSVSWYAYTEKISDSGIMGDPTRASAEKGRKMWSIMIAHLVAFVEDLKSMSLEEIFQRRY